SLISARIRTTPELALVRRDTLFLMNALPGEVQAGYDIFPDAKRFVFPRIVSSGADATVVTGWLDDVRERMAASANK
ncbi:MAG: hypothetical protein AB1762_19675, partial [Gemmatimonadota bacterium]